MAEKTKVITKDGSVTFHNAHYGETYHSVSGAEEEALKKFAEPCLQNVGAAVKILDICFGLGYNSAAALDLIHSQDTTCVVEIVGLENDTEILEKIQGLNPNFTKYDLIKGATTSCLNMNDSNTVENTSIKIIVGDARETIAQCGSGFHVVFLDPFSPKKCPELWTEQFFKKVYGVMEKGGVLATYSCARSVRDNLKKVGFVVEDGPVVGRKAPGTIAVK
jgi:tRNA U34 5-methylaminomethyl-2-thiouridine-forming methyltransferase MnmC